MPTVKLMDLNNDAMKSDEGNDSLDTIIRQVAKEPSISFSRAGDSPVPWIQLLHALDQQELPGWPLHSPIKVQMQKCDKCSREFCSTINYRRHVRVNHRLKNLDKDSTRNRVLLGEFWDKLSIEEAKESVSFNDVNLEEVAGSSILKALTTLIRKPGFTSLPHTYLKAGSSLLDIVQARPSRFPISSQDLFSILDDASEKTFLSGTATSMQRYIFDGDAAKVGPETKNLVACTSFLVEQNLVKAWHAYKDGEALRLQNLLVEEEEAAQRRQAELMERKRQKKLRQKELKAKDQDKVNDTEIYDEPLEETSSHSTTIDSEAPSSDMLDYAHLSVEAFEDLSTNENVDPESQIGIGCGRAESSNGTNMEQRTVKGNGTRRVVARWQVLPKLQGIVPHGFHARLASQTSKLPAMQNHGSYRDSRPVSGSNKVWSRKPKPQNDGVGLKAAAQKDGTEPDQTKNHEVLIGSIPVTLGNSCQESNNLAANREDALLEQQIPEKNFQDKTNKLDSVLSNTNRSTVKLWRPVSQNGTKGPLMPVQKGCKEFETDGEAEKGYSRVIYNGNFQDDAIHNSSTQPGSLGFSSRAAKEFLAQRWKEAIAGDHVELVLFDDSEPAQSPEINSEVASTHSSSFRRSILRNAENRLANVEAVAPPVAGAVKVKYRSKKHEKGVKIKYIPKQNTVT